MPFEIFDAVDKRDSVSVLAVEAFLVRFALAGGCFLAAGCFDDDLLDARLTLGAVFRALEAVFWLCCVYGIAAG